MKILHLISSPRGGASASIKLGNVITEQLKIKYPGSEVIIRDLTTDPLPHLSEEHLASFFTPADDRTKELVVAAQPSDTAIAQLMNADILVIGVPMYNFHIHSGLKAWIDHILRAGITFSYSAEGPQGLLKEKKAYLAIATGGIYSEGPQKKVDFIEPYLNNILNFIGISDITTYRAEGLAIPDAGAQALEKAIAGIAV